MKYAVRGVEFSDPGLKTDLVTNGNFNIDTWFNGQLGD